MPTRDRSFLSRPEREVLARELRLLVGELGSQVTAAVALGCSQPAISAAIGKRLAAGPEIKERVLRYRSTTMEALAEKHGVRLDVPGLARPVLRDHKDWTAAARQAKALYPALEDQWVALAGDVSLPEGAPRTLDGVFVGDLAQALKRLASLGKLARPSTR